MLSLSSKHLQTVSPLINAHLVSFQNVPIAHPKLKSVLDPVIALYDDVKRKCVLRLEYENKVKCEALTSPTSKFYQMPFEYAMSIYCYYVCFKCKKVCLVIIQNL